MSKSPVTTQPGRAKIFDQPLPHSAEAEMALLGAMILDPAVVPAVLDIVSSREDFHSEQHSTIFDAIVGVHDRDNNLDLVMLLDWLRGRGTIDLAGGDAYLLQLAEGVPSAANYAYYAKIVREHAKRRRVVMACEQGLHDAVTNGDADEALDRLEASVMAIGETRRQNRANALEAILAAEIENIRGGVVAGQGLPTGYVDLDRKTRGLHRGEMTILAARPSVGKSALMMNIAEQLCRGGILPGTTAKHHIPVGVFSLEMSGSSLARRLISAYAGVDSHRMNSGMLSSEERERIADSETQMRAMPIHIADMPGATVREIRSQTRRWMDRLGIQVVFIDYLQLITPQGGGRDNREVQVGQISRGLKGLAMELDMPVFVLSQLNRGSEQREGGRPRMSDLRESGSIEQDADVVMLLHRPEYGQSESWRNANPDKCGVAELIVAKQRNGPTGGVMLAWNERTTRFSTLAREREYAGIQTDKSPFEEDQ